MESEAKAQAQDYIDSEAEATIMQMYYDFMNAEIEEDEEEKEWRIKKEKEWQIKKEKGIENASENVKDRR